MSDCSKKRNAGWDEDQNLEQFPSSVRSGKWTTEEENFANQLVVNFEKGTLNDCEDGCTLRSYLAKKLNCAPMRISKKLAGRCVGKLAYTKRQLTGDGVVHENNLAHLEELYRESCRAASKKIKRDRTDRSSSITSSSNASTSSESDDGLEDITFDEEMSRNSSLYYALANPGELNSVFLDDLDIDTFDEKRNELPLLNQETFIDPREWQEVMELLSGECLPNFYLDNNLPGFY